MIDVLDIHVAFADCGMLIESLIKKYEENGGPSRYEVTTPTHKMDVAYRPPNTWLDYPCIAGWCAPLDHPLGMYITSHYFRYEYVQGRWVDKQNLPPNWPQATIRGVLVSVIRGQVT